MEVGGVDCYVGVEPDSATVATRLARSRGGVSVFDIHEVYHDEMLKRWVPNWARPVAGAIVKWRLRALCRRVDLVVGAGVTRVRPYQDERKGSLVVRHCLPRESAFKAQADPFGNGKPVIRIMHGKCTLNQGTKEVLKATVLAQQRLRNRAILKLFCFQTFGGFDSFSKADFDEFVEEIGAAEIVEMHDPVRFQQMLPLIASCDLGIIAYGREFGVNCMPNRIFEYMAVGLPVIVPSYALEMKAIIERYRCGVMVNTEDSEAICEAICGLFRDTNGANEMGARGRQAVRDELHMEREVVPLIEWIKGKAVASHIAVGN